MNPYKKLLSIIPGSRIDVGTITIKYDIDLLVRLQDGGLTMVKGTGDVGKRVYIKDGYVIGDAPNLTGNTFDI